MATFFIVLIYMAFISLGLPDSLLGVAWPLMQSEYGAPFDAAGMISMFIAGGTIVSSLASGAIHKRLNTGKITFISCLMTALSLLGFSFAPSLVWVILLAIPLGLGAGSVDAALNNYVAIHYKAHHMSWLHCFWGVGATVGPVIMAYFIAEENSWRNGYFTVALIQFSLVVLLFISLPLWNRIEKKGHIDVIEESDSTIEVQETKNVLITEKSEDIDLTASNKVIEEKKVKYLSIKGVKLALTTFLFYCGVESTMGLWGSSFLINMKGLTPEVAAKWVSLYFAGITIGRFLTGFITLKVSNPVLIRIGQITTLIGIIFVILPLASVFSLVGFILVGLGCAPIFPCMIHETPVRFGKENSQTIIGYQMALAYTGSTFLPPILGVIAARTTIGFFPFFILVYIIFMFIASEKINNLK